MMAQHSPLPNNHTVFDFSTSPVYGGGRSTKRFGWGEIPHA